MIMKYTGALGFGKYRHMQAKLNISSHVVTITTWWMSWFDYIIPFVNASHLDTHLLDGYSYTH